MRSRSSRWLIGSIIEGEGTSTGRELESKVAANGSREERLGVTVATCSQVSRW